MRALVVLIAAIVIFIFLRWLLQQPPRVRWQLAAVLAGGGLIALAATGRLHWFAAAIGALLPFARRFMGLLGVLPILQRLAAHFNAAHSAAGPTGGNTSTVESRCLRMSLDHDTGEMDGVVLDGALKGKRLGELGLETLLELLAEFHAQDEESAALLQAYLDKVYGEDWRDGTQSEQTDGAETPSGPDTMSREQAYDILGLTPGASRDAIIEAHRRLMQRVHPDRGGSTYLAAKINQAKDVLLS